MSHEDSKMECPYCYQDSEPSLLNFDGVNSELPGDPVYWGHAYEGENDWWPCQRKAAEEHAALLRLLAASESMDRYLSVKQTRELLAAREFARSVVKPEEK